MCDNFGFRHDGSRSNKTSSANNISEPKNTILIVGYCAPTTLGAKIGRGDKEVSIFGTVHEVKAEVKKIESFSGHADYKNLSVF